MSVKPKISAPDPSVVPEPEPAAVKAAALTNTVSCHFCQRTQEVCRSRIRNVFEFFILPLVVPYRCLYCGHRGFAFRFQVPDTPANQEILRDSKSSNFRHPGERRSTK